MISQKHASRCDCCNIELFKEFGSAVSRSSIGWWFPGPIIELCGNLFPFAIIRCHIEKEGSNNISSIPSLSSQYHDASIVTVHQDNSRKLPIGTNISNVLVTSSIRIDDSSYTPELSPTTNNFRVSENARLFLSINSIEKYNTIIEAKKNILVLKHNIFNLKQIRSQYHKVSTYMFSRGFSLFTHDIANTPLTIFTISEIQHVHNQDVILSSHILKDVVWAALTDNNLKQDDFL